MANPLMAAVYRLPYSDHKSFKYGQYSNLVYLSVLGKTAATIRKERGLGRKCSVSLLLSPAEKAEVRRMQVEVAKLMNQGMSYQEIKAKVMEKAEG